MTRARQEWWMNVDMLILKTKRVLHNRLFTLTRMMRESAGGEIACCGAFRPDFVIQIPDNDRQITEDESKTLIKILKAVSGGARRILRIAAELQLGLNGVNWRQTTMPQFYKNTTAPKKTRSRRNWTDAGTTSPALDGAIKNNNKINKNIKNRKITINNVFDFTSQIGNIVYWEIKAG